MTTGTSQRNSSPWVSFPGGELEGKRPKALCSSCREDIARAAAGSARPTSPRPLCFACYRAGLERERALKAAGQLDTATSERFQVALPFEPVNRARLAVLKVERAAERTTFQQGLTRFADKRRQAQLSARRALQRVAAGLAARSADSVSVATRERDVAAAIHAAELQLPESWIPFVVSL